MFQESLVMSPPNKESRNDFKKEGDDRDRFLRSERRMLVALIICVILIILLVIVIFLFRSQMERKQFKTCYSADCVIVSGERLAQMNFSAKPCDDFYQYACRNELTNLLVVPNKKRWTVFDQVRKKNNVMLKQVLGEPGFVYKKENSTAVEMAKLFYQSCLNTRAIEELGSAPMQKLIRQLGSWPLSPGEVMGTWKEEDWSLESSLAQAHSLGAGGLFSFAISIDFWNSTVYKPTIDQGGLTYSRVDFYLGNHSDHYRQAFLEYVGDVITLLGADENKSREAAEDIWKFESDLAEFYLNEEDRQNIWNLYERMTLQDLQDAYLGQFNLSVYLREVFGQDVPLEEKFQVGASSYLNKTMDLATSTPPKILANYLMWHVVHRMLPSMPRQYTSILQHFRKVSYGDTGQVPRWEECVARTDEVLPFATGALFVERYFPQERKEEIILMVDYILGAFEQLLQAVKWMDSKTRAEAVKKLRATKRKIAYPSFIEDPKELDNYHIYAELHENDHFWNQLALYSLTTNKSLSYRGKLNQNRWMSGPTKVNAYYSFHANEIVLPAGILQSPYYDTRYPMAMNFGALGYIIAHEISHGFDSRGRNFNKDGNLFNWWTNSSRENFSRTKQCLLDQYNEYKINGATTLNENIADNGGVKIAFFAYMKWLDDHEWKDPGMRLPGLGFSEEQTFFLAYAQNWCTYHARKFAEETTSPVVHANNKYRVIGPLSNFLEFVDAFDCHSPLYAMNPPQKCTLW